MGRLFIFFSIQISRMRSESQENVPNLRLELGERVTELTSVRKELDRVKKDKNITSGLVTQMQRDMANKVCTFILTVPSYFSPRQVHVC